MYLEVDTLDNLTPSPCVCTRSSLPWNLMYSITARMSCIEDKKHSIRNTPLIWYVIKVLLTLGPPPSRTFPGIASSELHNLIAVNVMLIGSWPCLLITDADVHYFPVAGWSSRNEDAYWGYRRTCRADRHIQESSFQRVDEENLCWCQRSTAAHSLFKCSLWGKQEIWICARRVIYSSLIHK